MYNLQRATVIGTMASYNPFFNEWQECLRAHYQHVIRENDLVTEPTLHGVLLRTGFNEEQINRLRFEVLGEVPEAPVIEETMVEEIIVVEEIIPQPVPEIIAEPVAAVEAAPESAPLPEEIIPEPEPPPVVAPKPPPKQLSLF